MIIRFLALVASTLVAIGGVSGSTAPQEKTYRPDDEGYIRNWLILGPIPNEARSRGEAEVDRNQLPNEGNLAPMAGEKITVRGKALAWKKYKTPKFYVDFNDWLKHPANVREEHVLGYIVTYIHSDRERSKLQCRMISNDQGKLYLNGRELLKFRNTRAIVKGEEDIARNVTLKKGRNVVVFKIINESNNWGGCVRFTDAKGKPVTDIRMTTPSKP